MFVIVTETHTITNRNACYALHTGGSSPQKLLAAKERSCLPLSSSKPGSRLGKKRKNADHQRAMKCCLQRQRKLLVKKLQQPLLFGHDPNRKAEMIMWGFSSQLASATQLNKKLGTTVTIPCMQLTYTPPMLRNHQPYVQSVCYHA